MIVLKALTYANFLCTSSVALNSTFSITTPYTPLQTTYRPATTPFELQADELNLIDKDVKEGISKYKEMNRARSSQTYNVLGNNIANTNKERPEAITTKGTHAEIGFTEQKDPKAAKLRMETSNEGIYGQSSATVHPSEVDKEEIATIEGETPRTKSRDILSKRLEHRNSREINARGKPPIYPVRFFFPYDIGDVFTSKHNQNGKIPASDATALHCCLLNIGFSHNDNFVTFYFEDSNTIDNPPAIKDLALECESESIKISYVKDMCTRKGSADVLTRLDANHNKFFCITYNPGNLTETQKLDLNTIIKSRRHNMYLQERNKKITSIGEESNEGGYSINVDQLPERKHMNKTCSYSSYKPKQILDENDCAHNGKDCTEKLNLQTNGTITSNNHQFTSILDDLGLEVEDQEIVDSLGDSDAFYSILSKFAKKLDEALRRVCLRINYYDTHMKVGSDGNSDQAYIRNISQEILKIYNAGLKGKYNIYVGLTSEMDEKNKQSFDIYDEFLQEMTADLERLMRKLQNATSLTEKRQFLANMMGNCCEKTYISTASNNCKGKASDKNLSTNLGTRIGPYNSFVWIFAGAVILRIKMYL